VKKDEAGQTEYKIRRRESEEREKTDGDEDGQK